MEKKRKLFSELSPFTYSLSVFLHQTRRRLDDTLSRQTFARQKSPEPLPCLVYSHKSLIRRRLGDVDMRLQQNKAVNLALAAPRVSHILIRPGEVFSFWHLVGSCTARKGYREGLVIRQGQVSSGIGGGMCQFTNLIHWLALHSPLEVVERRHHDGYDLFPDFGRQVPFGCGTSIFYNYVDYRLKNATDNAFQLIVSVDDEGEYLRGELRSAEPLLHRYHIRLLSEHFSREGGVVYRNNRIHRTVVDKVSGNTLSDELLQVSRAKVLYSTDHLTIAEEAQG